MQIPDQLEEYSYLNNWFHSWLHGFHMMPQTLESMLQGEARVQNLEDLKFFLKQQVLFRVSICSVRQTLGFNVPEWGKRSKSSVI